VLTERELKDLNEDETRDQLFHPMMKKIGYPPSSNTVVEKEHYKQQKMLRVDSKIRKKRKYDGCYCIGNTPLILVELKSWKEIQNESDLQSAFEQALEEAKSKDFVKPPPFILVSNGSEKWTVFYRIESKDSKNYELVQSLTNWEDIKSFGQHGEFVKQILLSSQLEKLLIYHSKNIEADIIKQVRNYRFQYKKTKDMKLVDAIKLYKIRSKIINDFNNLWEEKEAELATTDEDKIINEITVSASLNYLNKVFFLAICEDRYPEGFHRIIKEFLVIEQNKTTKLSVEILLGLLKRRILDEGHWTKELEETYVNVKNELFGELKSQVIDPNNWFDIIRVAFMLAEEQFPMIYRRSVYDNFFPSKETLRELITELQQYDFKQITNMEIGNIYETLLNQKGEYQHALGAYYTPKLTVEFMINRLNLSTNHKILEPCCGSGHFVEAIFENLSQIYGKLGWEEKKIYDEIVGTLIFAFDIDSFAVQLTAMRLFFANQSFSMIIPKIFQRDTLFLWKRKGQLYLFDEDQKPLSDASKAFVVSVEQKELESKQELDSTKFDRIIGNPPWGGKPPKSRKEIYDLIYGEKGHDTGSNESYSMFIVNSMERLREGGIMCFITSDSFLSISTHEKLRKYILNNCLIKEILLAPQNLFPHARFQFAGRSIITLEKCSGNENLEIREKNKMRLIERLRNEDEYQLYFTEEIQPHEKLQIRKQKDYRIITGNPFFIGVPDEVLEIFKNIKTTIQTYADVGAGISIAAELVPKYVKQFSDISSQEKSEKNWKPWIRGRGFTDYHDGEYLTDTWIDWSNEAQNEIRTHANTRIYNERFFFQEMVVFSLVGSRISCRLQPAGGIPYRSAQFIISDDLNEVSHEFLVGFLNSSLATYLVKNIINTTVNLQVNDINRIPFKLPGSTLSKQVSTLVNSIVEKLVKDKNYNPEKERKEIDKLIFEFYNIDNETAVKIQNFYYSL